jgi:hypothetical protein
MTNRERTGKLNNHWQEQVAVITIRNPKSRLSSDAKTAQGDEKVGSPY